MVGIIYLAAYELCGALIAERLFSGRGRQIRLWLGMTLGCGMLMWFPSLFAFLMKFTLTAQLLEEARQGTLIGGKTAFDRLSTRKAGPGENPDVTEQYKQLREEWKERVAAARQPLPENPERERAHFFL